MNNRFTGTRIEYHILQSFPVTCLNRDDVGSPKDAIVGGVRRARISSQCWKRQVRLMLHEQGLQIALRTKKIKELLLNGIEEPSEDMINAAETISSIIASDTLVYISEGEVKALQEFMINNVSKLNGKEGEGDDNSKDEKKSAKGKKESKDFSKTIFEVMKSARNKAFSSLDGLDIALFGRMLANATDLNVQAACSFAHAITTHKVSPEIDYFTAVDDLPSDDKAGAGHIGANEFNSGTFYRYVSLDLGMLYDCIGDVDDMNKAIEAFTKALFLAVPAARQNTFAGYCLWDYAHVYVRKGQGVQISFDKPVRAGKEGYLEPSIKQLEENLNLIATRMGSLFGKKAEFVFGSDKYSIDNLCNDLKSTIETIQ